MDVVQYPKYKVAAAHVAPIFGDVVRTVDKACSVIAEAARSGARLVAFSETFVAGYPIWARLAVPIESHALFAEMAANAIRINGPEMHRLRNAARANDIFVSIGFNEGTNASVGCLWNANVLIGSDGAILNHHRKLVPTFSEKLVWANGDGAGLRVSNTEIGRIGMLICGENTNPLARFALMAEGEQVHISSYLPVTTDCASGGSEGYDLKEAIHIRAAGHSFEAKVFNIVVSCPYDATAKQAVKSLGKAALDKLDKAPKGVSMVVGPTGRVVSEIYCENEGLCITEIDLALSVVPKRVQDVVGYYNRFDVFDLKVNRRRLHPIEFSDTSGLEARMDGAPRANTHTSATPSDKVEA